MRKLIFTTIIIISLILFTCSAENNNLDTIDQELLTYALDKQQEYAMCMNSESSNFDYESDTLHDFFTNLPASDPKAAIILRSKPTFQGNIWAESHNLPYSIIPTLCFNRMYNLTHTYTGDHLANIANTTALLDIATMDDLPSMCYVVLLFGNDTPQIVTAFSLASENTAITYTTFVYASEEKRESYNGYFAYDVTTYWGSDTFDVTIVDLNS